MRDKASHRRSVGLPGVSFRNPERMQDLGPFSSWPVSITETRSENRKESHTSQEVLFVLELDQTGLRLPVTRKAPCLPCCTPSSTHQSHNIYQGRPALMSSAQRLPSPPNALQLYPGGVPGLPAFSQGFLLQRTLTFRQAAPGCPRERSKVQRARTQHGNNAVTHESGAPLPSSQLRCATRKWRRGSTKRVRKDPGAEVPPSLWEGSESSVWKQRKKSTAPCWLSRVQALGPARLRYAPFLC